RPGDPCAACGPARPGRMEAPGQPRGRHSPRPADRPSRDPLDVLSRAGPWDRPVQPTPPSGADGRPRPDVAWTVRWWTPADRPSSRARGVVAWLPTAGGLMAQSGATAGSCGTV